MPGFGSGSPNPQRNPSQGRPGYGELLESGALASPGSRRQRPSGRDWLAASIVPCTIRCGFILGLALFVYGVYMLVCDDGSGGEVAYNNAARSVPTPSYGAPQEPALTTPSSVDDLRTTPAPAPIQVTTPPPYTRNPNLPEGTTEMTVINNDFSDGVIFCRGPVEGSLENVFLDEALSQPVVQSPYDCSVPDSAAAKQWGKGVPGGSTLAFGLKRGESATLYIAPDGGWPSGACWFQDVYSNQKMSIAKGPQYMSQVEFTIEPNGKGAVWYDMSSVEGVSGGITMNYTDDDGKTQIDVAIPGPFQGSLLKVVPAPGIGFPTILSDKNTLGACSCDVWSKDSNECNTDACYAGCPGNLVDNACGQHRCRLYYANQYKNPETYCGWLYQSRAQTYCWAMDEWQCVDDTCGYGGLDQPKADCSSKLPKNAAANTYSCGHGSNLPTGEKGELYWTTGPGCKDKMVEGVPTNPAPPRHGGRILISFESLPWLHEQFQIS